MNKTDYYCQCTLEKYAKNYTATKVSFIPEQFAFAGNVLKLKNEDGEWVEGWIVQLVGHKVDADFVESHERDYSRQRKSSDI
jgi:uncharacterized membrane protein YGL010W